MIAAQEKFRITTTVVSIVLKHWLRAARWVERDDLEQEAWLAALEGLARAREVDGGQLHAYLRLRVNGAIHDFIGRKMRPIFATEHTRFLVSTHPVSDPSGALEANCDLPKAIEQVRRAITELRPQEQAAALEAVEYDASRMEDGPYRYPNKFMGRSAAKLRQIMARAQSQKEI